MDKILMFTGAGISKESGIPTFEELGAAFRDGLSRKRFKKDPKGFYDDLLRLRAACLQAEPNAAHKIIAALGLQTITMNIDSLHSRAGLDKSKLIEIHGSIDNVFCKECEKVYPFSIIENGIHCPNCKTLLEHYIVLYGDQIPELQKALAMVPQYDILIIVGTSFYTSTSSYIYEEAIKHNKKVYIIDEKATENLPKLLDKLK